MSEVKNIAAALVNAQKQMTKAQKGAKNPHFRSKYADLGNVMDACMSALNENGIAVLQPITTDAHGNRFVETTFIHTSGETLSCSVPLIVSKNDMQGFGSAVTYARRYGLMAMAGIAPEDDDGNAAAKAPPKNEPQYNGPTKEEVGAVVSALESAPNLDALKAVWTNNTKLQKMQAVIDAKEKRKAELSADIISQVDLNGDSIPY